MPMCLSKPERNWAVSRGVDIFRIGHSAFEQTVEALVIAGKIAVNFSRHRKYLSMGLLKFSCSSADVI